MGNPAASAGGNTVLLTAKTAGATGNSIPLSISVSSNATQWNGQSYTCTSASGSTLSGGKDAQTKYDSGACTITVNGHSDNYSLVRFGDNGGQHCKRVGERD